MMENEDVKRNWREFAVSPPALRAGVAYVSINADGRIRINREVWEMLGGAKHVSLLYDEDAMLIGVRPVSRVMPNSFPVVTDKVRPRRIFIRGRDFLDAARIDISYCVRFLDPHMEDDTLILDLNQTARVLGPRKRRDI